MDLIIKGIWQAIVLLFSFDPEVIGITFLTLKVSSIATLFSLLLGIGIGMFIGLNQFPGR